jgi:hypothetical protein
VFTALNLLPSMAATAWANRSTAQLDELTAGRPDRRAVVLPEVRNGLEVRRQALRQPHHLDIALALPLQPTARSDLVDVAIDVDLQQHAGMIRRPSGRLGHDAREPQNTQVQLVDEHIDHPYRVLVRYVFIQKFRKQDGLPTILTLDEALHLKPRSSGLRILAQ